MKILHLSNIIGEHKGGGLHEVVSNLYINQKKLNHEPHIWYPGKHEDANTFRQDSNILALSTLGNLKYGLVNNLFSPLPKELKNFQIIHQHGIWMPMSLLAKKIKFAFNIKSIIQPHGYLLEHSLNLSKYKKKTAYYLYEKSNLESAQVLIACALPEALKLKELFPNKEIAIIPNGISLEFFNSKKTFSHAENKKKTVLFLSQIIPIKGIERIFKSIKSIGIKSFFDWDFIIAGYADTHYKRYLQNMVKEFRLQDLVTFVGPKFGKDKIQIFDSSDVFILPSYNENYGIVVAEALARGVPVITTKGTPWEELNKYDCGFWEENSDEGIKTALLKLLDCNKRKLTRMGNRGRELIKRKYLWNKTSLKTIKLYDWVLNQKEKPNFII